MEKKRIVILVVAILAGLFIIYILTGGNFGISGKAVTESDSLIVTCEETDGGDNPNIKGNVTQTYLKDTPYRKKGPVYFYDVCGYGDTITEYYCSTKNYAGTKVYHCEKGCKDGACISSESTQEEQETETISESEETTPPEPSEKSSSIFTKVID